MMQQEAQANTFITFLATTIVDFIRLGEFINPFIIILSLRKQRNNNKLIKVPGA
jgi:hypothetical protein